MEREFGDALWDVNSPKHMAVKTAYQASRQAIKDLLNVRTGNQYEQLMNQESLLFTAKHNIAEQFYSLLGKRGLALFSVQHPTVSKAAKIIAGVGSAGLLIETGRRLFWGQR